MKRVAGINGMRRNADVGNFIGMASEEKKERTGDEPAKKSEIRRSKSERSPKSENRTIQTPGAFPYFGL
jgi:hypothetical protein